MHPVHVSLTNVEYNEQKEEFDIVFKLFMDDFEAIIEHKYGSKIKINSSEKDNEKQKYMTKYILEHFKFIIDEKDFTKEKLKFVKKENNQQAVWVYYRFKQKENIKKIEIKNSLMNDHFNDQKNLLFFKYKNTQEAVSLNKEEDIFKAEID